jgi:MFS transporter, DHA1 family, multidrug resistance protein
VTTSVESAAPPTSVTETAIPLASSHGQSPAQDILRGNTLIWLLAALFATQPIATDLYLASLPALKTYFSVTTSAVQLTLGIYMLSFSFSHLIVGPISDRFGRRPVVLAGAALYLVGSLIGTFTPSFYGLLVARALQAVGASCTAICARALVRDLYEPRQAAGALSKAFMLMSLVPMISPILGGVLQTQFGWRANFALISILSMLIFLASYRLLVETIPHKNPNATRSREVLRNYLELARSPILLTYTFASMFSYACLFTFISGSPFVMIEVLKVPTSYFGFCFAVVTLGFILGSRFLQRHLGRIGIDRSLRRGAMISLVSSSALVVLALLKIQTLSAFLVPMFGVMVAHGFIQPSSQAGAIGSFPEKAGAAAALVGFIIYIFAALVGSVVGASHNGTTLPLATIIFCMSLCCVFTCTVLVKRLKNTKFVP